MTMTYVSFTGYLRYAGGFSASLSSAIASLVGAPRVLQAVGKDKIYPGIFFFAKGYTANNDPYHGYILVFVVAMGFTMVASLNGVSVIASNFFLAAYALMNLSCFHSSITKAPSWRPSYTWYNPWVSFFSTFLCIGIMFALSWMWASATVGILLLLGLYIFYANPETNWGSSTQGQVFVSAINSVHTLTETPGSTAAHILWQGRLPSYTNPLQNTSRTTGQRSSCSPETRLTDQVRGPFSPNRLL